MHDNLTVISRDNTRTDHIISGMKPENIRFSITPITNLFENTAWSLLCAFHCNEYQYSIEITILNISTIVN